MKDYNGKVVYLGIDVHKKTYAVTAICEGQVVKKDTLKAEPSSLVSYCKKRFPGARIETAYEAGFSGFYLHRYLEENGIKSRVIHAAGVEIASGNRVKTDKRDSLRLATQLSVGRLKGIHVPSREREDARIVTRLRETFVQKRTSVGGQIKGLLYQHGLIAHDSNEKVSPKWIQRLLEKQLPQGLMFAIKQFSTLWLELNERIKGIDEQMASQAKKEGALEMLYRSVPGIGPVVARTLANELGDMSQFGNERQLFCYTGFTPSEHSSGEHVRQGHISRQGKPVFRKLLVQSAWTAIRLDNGLREIFDRISAKAGSKRAIVAIARRLIGKIRACLRTGCMYEFFSKNKSNLSSASI